MVGARDCSICMVDHVRSRERFQKVLEDNNVPLALCLNYDQTWVQAFRTPKSMLKRKRTASSRDPKSQTRVLNIVGGRNGISLCTSSFANGDRGPLFISVGAKSVPQKWVDSMNQFLVL